LKFLEDRRTECGHIVGLNGSPKVRHRIIKPRSIGGIAGLGGSDIEVLERSGNKIIRVISGAAGEGAAPFGDGLELRQQIAKQLSAGIVAALLCLAELSLELREAHALEAFRCVLLRADFGITRRQLIAQGDL